MKVESDIDTDAFETFPLYLAVMIVFTYIAACSVIINLWEDWDWFTAFYYLFISMSTIGLGDEMPEHPHFAVCKSERLFGSHASAPSKAILAQTIMGCRDPSDA